MAALFAIFGSSTPAQAEAMADALAHRAGPGERVRIESLGGPESVHGFVGVIDRDPDRVLSTDDRGRVLATHADLYVEGRPADILGAAIDGGPAALEPLDGQFAALRWDPTDRSVTVATDSMGTVPLYRTALPSGGFAFASEYKALLTLPGVAASLDRGMAAYLQHAKSLPIGRTLALGIDCIEPGLLREHEADGRVRNESHFGSVPADPMISDLSEACELIRTALEGAVERRARDLDPVGICLSGGIDSIAMAFCLRRLFPDRTIRSFTAGSSAGDHECVTARKVAQAVGAEHSEVITPPSMLRDRLEPLVWHLEDPYARTETLQLRECARAARDSGLTHLLVAQGADDLFAGMPKCRLLWLMKLCPPAARGFWEFYEYTQTSLPPNSALGRLLNRLKHKGQVPPPARVLGTDTTPGRSRTPRVHRHFINELLAGQFQSSTHKSTKKMERVFASFGIGYRSPFHDRELALSAYRIDERLKVTRREQKFVLREAMSAWVPAEFVRIPKFPQRMAYNQAFAEELDNVFDRHLGDDRVRARGVFDPPSVAALKRNDNSRAYRDEAAMRIWTACLTELWCRRFADAKAEPEAESATCADQSSREGAA